MLNQSYNIDTKFKNFVNERIKTFNKDGFIWCAILPLELMDGIEQALLNFYWATAWGGQRFMGCVTFPFLI